MLVDRSAGEAWRIQLESLRPATILEEAGKDGWCDVHIDEGLCACRARVALPGYEPRVGDEVLVVGNPEKELFVLGVLSQSDLSRRLELGDHAHVIMDRSQESPCLRVVSDERRTVLEYEVASGRTRIRVEEGDLDIRAGGTLRLSAPILEAQAERLENRTAAPLRQGDHLSAALEHLKLAAGPAIQKMRRLCRWAVRGTRHGAGRLRAHLENRGPSWARNVMRRLRRDCEDRKVDRTGSRSG